MRSCSFDISDHTIKYGELIPTPLGIRLGRYGQVKMESGILTSGKVENTDKLVSILRDLKSKLDLYFVRVSLPEEQMYLFTLSLPKASIGESLRETILFQLEEHIPIKASDTVFDYNIVSEGTDATVVEVVAIATTTIQSYIDVFRSAGLEPISFELEAQAIARAVIEYTDKSPVMIVDFGEARTGVSIAHNGRVLFTTTLDIGGVALTSMIAKNFGITLEEAEKLKHDYGTGIPDSKSVEEILPVIINGVSVLRDELSKHYTYWKTHNDDGSAHESIDRILLCGGGANLPGVPEYLQLSMNIKVQHANVWINILDIKKVIPEMSHQQSLDYATVLGLALGDFDHSSKLTINVLPHEDKKALVREYWLRYANIFIVFFVVATLFSVVLMLPSYYVSTLKESIALDQMSSLSATSKEVNTVDIDAIATSINARVRLLSAIKGNYYVGTTVFGDMLATVPKGVALSQISYLEKVDDKNTVERDLALRGQALSRSTLSGFKQMLDNSSYFTKVELPTSDFLGKSNLPFSVSLTLK
jgi:type IV pilus assembly protein PilM